MLELSRRRAGFDADETAALLAALDGRGRRRDRGCELQRATGGWPAAVRLAVGGAARRAARPIGRRHSIASGGRAGRCSPTSPPRSSRTSRPRSRRWCGRSRRSTGSPPELCEALGVAGRRRDAPLARAARPLRRAAGHTRPAGTRSGRPVREFALAQPGHDDDELRRVADRRPRAGSRRTTSSEEALRCLAAAGDRTSSPACCRAEGRTLLARGAVDAVLARGRAPPARARPPPIELLAGEALQIRGDWDEALRCFERAAGDAPTAAAGARVAHGPPPPPRRAARRGDRDVRPGSERGRAARRRAPARLARVGALAARRRGRLPRGRRPRLRGRVGRRTIRRRSRPPTPSSRCSPRSRATAARTTRTTSARSTTRSRPGDVLQLIRVRTNRGSRHVEECAYEEAIAELDLALRLADLAGFAAFRALALTNRGEALARLGRFEEAVADLEARASPLPAARLAHGRVPAARSSARSTACAAQWALARGAFEEALAQAEASGDSRALVPSLAGLARVLVADEPDEAKRLVERALALGPGMNHVHALLAAGWVALARGDRGRAAERAAEAAAAAACAATAASLAESLELRALARRSPARRRRAARARRPRSGATCGNPAARGPRAQLELALLVGDADAAAQRRRALARCRARAATGAARRSLLDAPASACARRPVARPLPRPPRRRARPARAPGSRARRATCSRSSSPGAAARRPRDVLMEALWPGQSPAPLGKPALGPPQHRARACSTRRSATSRTTSSPPTGARVWLQPERRRGRRRARSSTAARGARAPPGGEPRGARAARRGRGRRTPATSSRRTPTRTGRSRCARRRGRRTRRSSARSPTDATARGDADAATRYSPPRPRARPLRRARPPRPRHDPRGGRTPRRGTPLLPRLLRPHGRDRHRVRAVPARRRERHRCRARFAL